MNVLQGAEVCIAVPGDSNISLLSWKSCTFDMSNPDCQRLRGGPFENCHHHFQSWDLNAAQNIAFLCGRPRRAYLALLLRMHLLFKGTICHFLIVSCLEQHQTNIRDRQCAQQEQEAPRPTKEQAASHA